MTTDNDLDLNLDNDADFERSLTDAMQNTAARARTSAGAKTKVIAQAERSTSTAHVGPRLAQVAAAIVLVGGVGYAAARSTDTGPERTIVGTELADGPGTTSVAGQAAAGAGGESRAPSTNDATTTTAPTTTAPPTTTTTAPPTTTTTTEQAAAIPAEAYLVFAVHEFPNDADAQPFRKHHLYRADGGYRFAEERADVFGPAAYVDDSFLTDLLTLVDDPALDAAALRAGVLATLPAVEPALEDNRVWVQTLAVLESGLATPTRQAQLLALVSTISEAEVDSMTIDGQPTRRIAVTNPEFDDYREEIVFTADGTPVRFTGSSADGAVAVEVQYEVEAIADLTEFGLKQLPDSIASAGGS